MRIVDLMSRPLIMICALVVIAMLGARRDVHAQAACYRLVDATITKPTVVTARCIDISGTITLMPGATLAIVSPGRIQFRANAKIIALAKPGARGKEGTRVDWIVDHESFWDARDTDRFCFTGRDEVGKQGEAGSHGGVIKIAAGSLRVGPNVSIVVAGGRGGSPGASVGKRCQCREHPTEDRGTYDMGAPPSEGMGQDGDAGTVTIAAVASSAAVNALAAAIQPTTSTVNKQYYSTSEWATFFWKSLFAISDEAHHAGFQKLP